MLWKNQLLNIIVTTGLEDHIEDKTQIPLSYLDEDRLVTNPKFKKWQRTDRMVMSWLYASLSPEPMNQIVGYNSAQEVWQVLQKRYQSTPTERVMSLRAQLQQLQKWGNTIQQYIAQLKVLTDSLAAVGEPITYKDHLGYLLEGLLAEYDAFITVVYNRSDEPSIKDIQSLIINFDLRLEKR